MSDTIKVGQIEGLLERPERRIHAKLHDITVSEMGNDVVVKNSEGVEETFEFDEVAERHFGQFLDVSPVYLKKCPSGLKAHNLNYWLHRMEQEQGEAILVVGPNGIENIHDPDKTVVSIPEIAGLISRTFDPEDEIVELISEPGTFHADIVMDSSKIIVPGNGVGDRPDAEGFVWKGGSDPLLTDEENAANRRRIKVDDVTHGGIRFLAYPNKHESPVVETYLYRIMCMNGQTIRETDQRVTVRGKTVDEVLESMEEIAQTLMGSLDEKLQAYKALTEVQVPGNVILFIQQMGREQGLSDKLITKSLDIAAAMGLGRSDVPVSAYDVMQIFTSLANMDGVRYSNRLKLQRVGGLFVHRGDDLMHRCDKCERPLL